MQIEVQKGDITKLNIDAIVNAANSSLLGGGGVDGVIHQAGGKAILEDCLAIRQQQGGCPTGEAVITTGGNLPARFVIHTVGPVWRGGNSGEPDLLKSCYINSLKTAEANDVKSIGFPNVSTGIYGYPKQEAASIAISAVQAFPSAIIERLIFVCFDEENFKIYESLLRL